MLGIHRLLAETVAGPAAAVRIVGAVVVVSCTCIILVEVVGAVVLLDSGGVGAAGLERFKLRLLVQDRGLAWRLPREGLAEFHSGV